MDTICQRGKIREESLFYKHDGSLPLVGVHTLLPKGHVGNIVTEIELIRSTPDKKGQQIRNVEALHARGQDEADIVGACLRAATSLSALQATADDRKNLFAALMETLTMHSVGQIGHALYEVDGGCRQNV